MLSKICIALCLASASAFQTGVSLRSQTARPVVRMSGEDRVAKAVVAAGAALSVAAGSASAKALTKDEFTSLTYDQIRGSTLANTCPTLNTGVDTSGKVVLDGKKKYVMDELCIQPKDFQVSEESTNRKGEVTRGYVPGKIMTRATYSLYGVDGDLSTEGGKITFKEKDGIDYAATTVQTPGGERVPFLFTVKELVATADASGSSIAPGFKMGGPFVVPSYRTGLFLDPKGRGMVTGYDMAVALPGLQNGEEGDKELFKENNKSFDVLGGKINLEVTGVDAETGDIVGVFASSQPSDTDLGSKTPKEILLKGVWYAHVGEK